MTDLGIFPPIMITPQRLVAEWLSAAVSGGFWQGLQIESNTRRPWSFGFGRRGTTLVLCYLDAPGSSL